MEIHLSRIGKINPFSVYYAKNITYLHTKIFHKEEMIQKAITTHYIHIKYPFMKKTSTNP